MTRKWNLTSVIVVASLFACADRAAGQAQTTASIVGRVTDESGAVLPGVTVTVTSPALQVPQVVDVTDAQGDYRVTPLPIGTYEVAYTLTGFQTVKRESLRLTAGFVAKLDVVLKVGAIQESVTVSATPTIDVQSSAPVTVLTKETLEIVPSSRSGLISLMNQSPSVRSQNDVGGSQANQLPAMRVYGVAAQANSWLVLEGVVATDAGQTGGGGSYFDYATFEEARMQTIANDVETPNRGINLNLIVKSGGNQFHGSYSWEQTNHTFQSSNVTPEFKAAGINNANYLVRRFFGGGDLGGRIVTNKLWFYVGFHARNNEEQSLGVFQPNGQPAVVDQSQAMFTEKVSYQMTPSQKLVAYDYFQRLVKDDPMTPLQGYETKQNNWQPQQTTKLEWQWVKGNSLVTSLQVSRWREHVTQNMKGTGPEKADIGTQFTSGTNTGAGNIVEHWRPWATRATLGWFKPDLFLGNHDFKTGYDDVRTTSGRGWLARPASLGGDYALRFNNAVPLQLVVYNAPNFPKTTAHSTGAYLADQWSIARRLSLNLGFRVARDDGYIPAQCRDAGSFKDPSGQPIYPAQCNPHIQSATQWSVVPRIYFSLDVTGDGKTAIKGGWGRFADWRNENHVLPNNPNVALQKVYTWHDLNTNGDYDPGEVNFAAGSTDFIQEVGRGNAAIALSQVNLNQPQTKEDQYSLSLERSLWTNFAVRATGLYSRRFNILAQKNLLRGSEVYTVANTKPDPGPDGKVGTADDPGTTLTWYEYPDAYRPVQFQLNTLVADPSAREHFGTIEVSAQKRLSHGWQLLLSESATHSDIPVPEGANINPNTYILAANNTWEWLTRASGAYVFPRQVMVSVNVESRSGDVQARTVSLSGGNTIPTISLRAAPIGSLRLPTQNTMDVRFSKGWSFGGRKVEIQMNLFNIFNANTVTARTVQSGANYLKPTAIQAARILDFNIAYSF
jgi:hypothetical protein